MNMLADFVWCQINAQSIILMTSAQTRGKQNREEEDEEREKEDGRKLELWQDEGNKEGGEEMSDEDTKMMRKEKDHNKDKERKRKDQVNKMEKNEGWGKQKMMMKI